MMPLPAGLEIQPQVAPLNDNACIALQDLNRKYLDDKTFEQQLKQAAALITEMTGSINDTAFTNKKRHDHKLTKLAARGEEENEDEKREHEAFQAKVAELTKKMDHSMRKTIDNRIWAEQLPENLRQVSTKAIDATTQPTQRTMPSDEDDEDNDTEPSTTVTHEDTPSAILHAALTMQSTGWTSKSLRDRYAHDHDYTSFYRTLWDAQHPSENAPPLPAPALWFAREENPTHSLSQTHPQDSFDGDSELVLAGETISLKCPITLQYYRDPVTSSVCNHSFERTAILNMLKISDQSLPFTPTQQAELSQLSRAERTRRENAMRIKRVRCPDSGCNKFFTEEHLRPNPVLLRKVNRELEAQRRLNAERDGYDEEDEDEDELQGPRGTQRKPLGLDGISSPPREDERMSRGRPNREVKNERRSIVPQTQPQRTMDVVDLDDDL